MNNWRCIYESLQGQVGDNNLQTRNEAFALALAEWVLHDRGVLKLEYVKHNFAGAPEASAQPTSYRVNDHVEVSARVVEKVNGKWEGFRADDVLVELTMMADPYVRQAFEHDGKGNFKTSFELPDRFGVFKFVVKYDRPGLSRLGFEQVTTGYSTLLSP